MARLVLTSTSDIRITLIDLPETNVMSSFFLARCFPQFVFSSSEGVFRLCDKDGKERVCIADPGYVESLPDGLFDLAVNTRSFMEMEIEVVNFYLDQIKRVLRDGGVFFCANRDFKYKAKWGDRPPFYFHKLNWGSGWELLALGDKCDQPSITQVTLRKDRDSDLDVATKLRTHFDAKLSPHLYWKFRRLAQRMMSFFEVKLRHRI